MLFHQGFVVVSRGGGEGVDGSMEHSTGHFLVVFALSLIARILSYTHTRVRCV